MLQAIFYLSLALAASPSTGMAADLATEVLTRADASASAAQKLQSSSKKAEAQKAAKKKAETKKAATKKSTTKKPATVAAKPKPVETAKTPWVMPDKKAIAAQRAKPQMTQVVKVATPAPAPVVTPPPAQTAMAQTPPVTQTPPPATSIAAFVAPATVTPPPSSPPAPSSAASTPQASPLNPLADILPPEVIAAAQTEANAPKAATAPVTATAAAEPKAALPVVEPAPVITPEVATPATPVLAKAVPETKPAVVTPAPVLNAPVASNIAPPVLQPKATLPPAKTEPESTLARAVKVDTYSRDYEGPKSDRELRYDAGIAQAFGSKVGQMSSLEGSWLVSGQDGKRLLSLELRGRTGGQIDGAWRALNSGFGLNRSGLLSEAALSQSNELSVSYLERGARAPSHLKLQKSDDGRWRGTLTDGSGHATPVIMMPDQS